MSRQTRAAAGALAGGLVPLAFFASAASLCALHTNPRNSVETAFLGLLATVVLTSLALVERTPHRIVAGTALLSAFALWALPAGGARGATLSLVLAGALGLVVWQGWPWRAHASRWSLLVALAISSQVLFRPEIWLAPSWNPTFVTAAIVLPAVTGLASAELSSGRGDALLPGVALVVALQRGISPELAVVLALSCGLAAAFERRWSAIAWATVAFAILLANVSELEPLVANGRGWHEVAGGLAWIALLVPAVFRPRPGRSAAILAALALAFAALWLLPAEAALILPFLVIFDSLPRATPVGRLQAAWSAVLIFGSALAASYPWLHPRPVETVLAWVGLDVGWRSAAIVVGTFWILVAVVRALRSRRPVDGHRTRWTTSAAIVALGAASVLDVLPSFRSLLAEPIVLSASRSHYEVPLTGSVDAIFVDSYASNGVSVAPGTPLAEVALNGPNGSRRLMILRAGFETGEWAARRPGLQVVAPQPWISWPATDGPYFAQRYRALERFEPAIEVTTLTLTRRPELPKELELAVLQVGARP